MPCDCCVTGSFFFLLSSGRRDIEDAARVEAFSVIRPGTAQIWLCGAAIGPVEAMEGAIQSLLVEKTASGDHLDLQGVLAPPADLTQIWREP